MFFSMILVSATATATGKDAYWYGINQYMFYDFTNTILRHKRRMFRDNNGPAHIGTPGNYFALTAGVNWKTKRLVHLAS